MVADWLGDVCDELDWVSDVEPLSPFDMLAEGGPVGPDLTYLDVKTTKAKFETRFYLSMGEADFAAFKADKPYRIVRVFEADSATPRACISKPINDWARRLLQAGNTTWPAGVSADGFVVSPDAHGLEWGAPFGLSAADDQ
jgi:hypothetical protein